MFGSEILGIAIGLAFVYLLLSLVVTAATESISRLCALRANNLYKGIQNLFGEFSPEATENTEASADESRKIPGAKEFYNSPIIQSLTQPGHIFTLLFARVARRPGYISARRFYEGLMQTLQLEDLKPAKLEEALETMPINENLRQNLQSFFKQADKDTKKFQSLIEDWYDDSMDRVSGWFKRRAHTITLAVSVVVTIVFNANTIKVAEVLWNDQATRAAVAKLAEEFVTEETPGQTPGAKSNPSPPAAANPSDQTTKQREAQQAIERGKKAVEVISQTSGLPLGWQGQRPFGHARELTASGEEVISGWGAKGWFSHLLGWTLTAFALSLGAPFWFDILKNLINLRTSGTKPAAGDGHAGAAPDQPAASRPVTGQGTDEASGAA